jgi:hypothetical protein
MSWQEEIEGKTLREAVQWFLDNIVSGKLIDNQTYEDVWHPWTGIHKRSDAIRLHRVWACKEANSGKRFVYCCDLEEYDDAEEPFFARAIMSLDEGPWGIQPPSGFGSRKDGTELHITSGGEWQKKAEEARGGRGRRRKLAECCRPEEARTITRGMLVAMRRAGIKAGYGWRVVKKSKLAVSGLEVWKPSQSKLGLEKVELSKDEHVALCLFERDWNNGN